ncbi:hypothetical protein [Haloarcula marina]|uniref:hypothetical protein n=2 Tax=Haloarcula marina TaxID=2961574 RepID=UPI0020B6BAFF|nr:hypothetical protein [Halomicroarcula marina]
MTETKGGNIILRRVDVPDHVDPGESFEVDALVSNGAAYINPWDGDKCGLAPPGYTIEVDFHGPDGATRTKGPMCHTTTEVGTRDETYTATFTAPEDGGEVEIEANVRLPGSGMETGTESAVLTVAEGHVPTPEPPGDDSNGDGGGGLDLGGAGGRNLKLAAGAIGLLALLWVLAPYAQLGASLSGGGR